MKQTKYIRILDSKQNYSYILILLYIYKMQENNLKSLRTNMKSGKVVIVKQMNNFK